MVRIRTAAAAVTLASLGMAASAHAAAAPATKTSTSDASSGPVIQLGSKGDVLFVVLVVGLFAASWFVLIFYDRVSASRRIYKLLPLLLEAAGSNDPKNRLSAKDIAAITTAARTQPKSTRGLTRTTLALVLVTLVGIALTALLVGDGSKASDLLK